jgi:hypothetical protein
MEQTNTKYPRTYHLPYSPGATKDDKRLGENWFKYYKDREIVITEKLDGENTCMNRYDVFARSHGVPTRSPWSKNMWEANGIWQKCHRLIGENEWVYGENLYGEHSIHYDKLRDYFHIFAVRNDDTYTWYSWNDVEMLALLLDIPTVPVLYRGTITSERELRTHVEYFTSQPSAYGDTREGVVIRIADEFPVDEFSHYVCKWVRPNHVTTDEHWTKNWRKAELCV